MNKVEATQDFSGLLLSPKGLRTTCYAAGKQTRNNMIKNSNEQVAAPPIRDQWVIAP